jgi:hypothetical protein
VRNDVAVILIQQLPLTGGELTVNVEDDEVYAVFVFVVERNGAASLPLGIESTLFKNEDVIHLALDQTAVGTGDERTILAVAVVIKVGIQLEILSPEACGHQQDENNDALHSDSNSTI